MDSREGIDNKRAEFHGRKKYFKMKQQSTMLNATDKKRMETCPLGREKWTWPIPF